MRFAAKTHVAFVLLLLGSSLLLRLGVLFIVGLLCRGQEFTSDAAMHLAMAEQPMQVLTGESSRFGQHPPLLPLLEFASMGPLRGWLPEFYVVRLGFLSFDLAATGLVLTRLATAPISAAKRRVMAGLVVANPVSIMTTVVMAQDESIAACFAIAALVLFDLRREGWASFVAGFGVVAAKIFLAPVALLLVYSSQRPGRTTWYALLPIAFCYGLALACRSSAFDVISFTPVPQFGINFWSLLVGTAISPTLARNVSAVAALALGLLPLLLTRHGNRPSPSLCAATMLAGIFSVFYHVNPEYLLLPCALLSLEVDYPGRLVYAIVVGTLGWTVNLSYGVALALKRGSTGGKGTLAHLFDDLSPFPAELVYPYLVVGFSIASVLLFLGLLGHCLAGTRQNPRLKPLLVTDR